MLVQGFDELMLLGKLESSLSCLALRQSQPVRVPRGRGELE